LLSREQVSSAVFHLPWGSIAPNPVFLGKPFSFEVHAQYVFRGGAYTISHEPMLPPVCPSLACYSAWISLYHLHLHTSRAFGGVGGMRN
jgi:hypothetical protein